MRILVPSSPSQATKEPLIGLGREGEFIYSEADSAKIADACHGKTGSQLPENSKTEIRPFFKLLHCLHSFNDQFCRYKSVPLSSRLAIEK
jgi:hypothetical protein